MSDVQLLTETNITIKILTFAFEKKKEKKHDAIIKVVMFNPLFFSGSNALQFFIALKIKSKHSFFKVAWINEFI